MNEVTRIGFALPVSACEVYVFREFDEWDRSTMRKQDMGSRDTMKIRRGINDLHLWRIARRMRRARLEIWGCRRRE